MNATATVIGLDIAMFVAVGRDKHGKLVLKRSLSRDAVIARLQICLRRRSALKPVLDRTIG
jgi:hypothetical protein